MIIDNIVFQKITSIVEFSNKKTTYSYIILNLKTYEKFKIANCAITVANRIILRDGHAGDTLMLCKDDYFMYSDKQNENGDFTKVMLQSSLSNLNLQDIIILIEDYVEMPISEYTFGTFL